MENQNIKAIEVLSNAMQNMIDKKVNNIARDRTRIGMVKTVNVDGTFKVLIDGREYDGVQAYGDGDIVANELVKIIYPDNNPTNMFILPKPSRRLATTNYSGWITPDEKYKLNNILYDSDNTLTLTVGSGKMFTTIQGALNSLPKNLNGCTVNINIDAGTYNENVVVTDFYGQGSIYLNGATVTTPTVPTTIVKSIDVNGSEVYTYVGYIKTNNSLAYNTGQYCAIRVNQCKYVSLQYVYTTITLTGTDDYSIVVSGGSNAAIGSYSTLGATRNGILVTTNSMMYATGTVTFGSHTTDVVAEYSGYFGSTNAIDTYDSNYGGSIISGSGLMGSTFTVSGSSYGTIGAGYVAQYYRASGLCVMSIQFNVTDSIATGSNITIASLNDSTLQADALTPLDVFRSDTTNIKAYMSTGGNIVVRTDTNLNSGTIYIGGTWKTKYN